MSHRRVISQREARRLEKRVEALERQIKGQRERWTGDYIGVEVSRAEWQPLDPVPVAIRTARKLGHAVVAVGNQNDGTVRFVALPHPSESV